MRLTAFAMFMLFVVSGCGVKGDPLPPEQPAKIGNGRPEKRPRVEKLKQEEASSQELDYDTDDTRSN